MLLSFATGMTVPWSNQPPSEGSIFRIKADQMLPKSVPKLKLHGAVPLCPVYIRVTGKSRCSSAASHLSHISVLYSLSSFPAFLSYLYLLPSFTVKTTSSATSVAFRWHPCKRVETTTVLERHNTHIDSNKPSVFYILFIHS